MHRPMKPECEGLAAVLTLGLLAPDEEKVDACCDVAAGLAISLSDEDVERAKAAAFDLAAAVKREEAAFALTSEQFKHLLQWVAQRFPHDPSLN